MFEEIKPHLAELRKRIVICSLTVLVFFAISFSFWKIIFDWMALPFNQAVSKYTVENKIKEQNNTNIVVFEGLVKNISIENSEKKWQDITKIMPEENSKIRITIETHQENNSSKIISTSQQTGSRLIATNIEGSFLAALKIAFFAGIIASLPVIFWQFWLFVAPGLYNNEKKMVLPFVAFTTIMFLIGGSFCYYLVMPTAFHFLMFFAPDYIQTLPTAQSYISIFTKMVIGFGISFELPVITLFLAKIGLVTDQTLKGFFRYAVVLIFLLSAFLTPPDIFSQFLMAIPLIGLYLLSIYIAKIVNPAKPEDSQDDEKEEEEKQN